MTDTGRIDVLLTQGRFSEAYDLARELATAGVSVAQMTLGWMYQVGKGIERDLEQAKFWSLSSSVAIATSRVLFRNCLLEPVGIRRCG